MKITNQTPTILQMEDDYIGLVHGILIFTLIFLGIFSFVLGSSINEVVLGKIFIPFSFVVMLLIQAVGGRRFFFSFDKSTNILEIYSKRFGRIIRARKFTLNKIKKIWISQYDGQRRYGRYSLWSVYLILDDGKRIPLTPGFDTIRTHLFKLSRKPAYIEKLSNWLGVPIEEGAGIGFGESIEKSYQDDDGKDEFLDN